MKKQFIIQDLTATDKKYIDENGENVNLVENAKVYDTEQEAQKVIEDNNWKSWAYLFFPSIIHAMLIRFSFSSIVLMISKF